VLFAADADADADGERRRDRFPRAMAGQESSAGGAAGGVSSVSLARFRHGGVQPARSAPRSEQMMSAATASSVPAAAMRSSQLG
jgi:hypothetical protein